MKIPSAHSTSLFRQNKNSKSAQKLIILPTVTKNREIWDAADATQILI